MRRLVASVAVTGSLLTACSGSTPAPFQTESPLRGDVIPARVIAEDRIFDPETATRPRFVPCEGLSGCARTSPQGDYYPGVDLPSGIDSQVDLSQEFVLYLAGGDFDQATLDGTMVHVRLAGTAKGFQMVKLDGQQVLAIPNPTFSFETENGTVICTASWGGCG